MPDRGRPWTRGPSELAVRRQSVREQGRTTDTWAGGPRGSPWYHPDPPDGHYDCPAFDRARHAASCVALRVGGAPRAAPDTAGAALAGRRARPAARALEPGSRLRAGRPARIREHRLQAGVRHRDRLVGPAAPAAAGPLRAGALPRAVVARPHGRGDGPGVAAGERA